MHWSSVLLHIAHDTGVVAPPQLTPLLEEWRKEQPDTPFFDWVENRLDGAVVDALAEQLGNAVFRCTFCHNVFRGDQLFQRDQLRCPRCHGASLLMPDEQSLSERDRRVLAGLSPEESEDERSLLATESDLAVTVAEREKRLMESSAIEPVGEWRVVALIGQAALGRVWKAWHDVLDRYSAVRTLEVSDSATIRERFRRGALSWSRLDHPKIVRVIELGSFADRPAVLCEWLDGGSVADLLARQERLRLDVAVDIAAQAAQGLAAAHDAGMLHCDVHAGSLLWSSSGTVKVTGFTLGQVRDAIRRLDEDVQPPELNCVAPELASGEPHMASDVWMLGTTLYQMITGREPTKPGNFAVPRLVDANPALPEDLDRLVADMTCEAPDDRPSMADVVKRLRTVHARESSNLRVTQMIRKPTTTIGEIDVLRLPRHPDSRTWIAVESTIDALTEQGARRFVIDLAECDRLDAAGLAVLRFLRDRVVGASLILAGVSRRLLIALEMMGVQNEFNITSSVDSAVEKLGGGPVRTYATTPKY